MNNLLKLIFVAFLLLQYKNIFYNQDSLNDTFFQKIIYSDSRLKDNSRELIDRQYGDFENEGVDVVIELFHNNNDNVLINDDNYSEIMTSNMIYIRNENERMFSIFNLCDYSSYYKCENIPFLLYKYNKVDDFYKNDLNKLSNFNKYIKNVFVENRESFDFANRNSSSYYHTYPFANALEDVGISATKTYDGTGVNIGSIESGIPNNYVNLSNTYYETFGSNQTTHCFYTSSIYGGDHGIASGANLFMAALNGSSFSECIDWLIGRGVNVINRSNGTANGKYNSASALIDYAIKNYKISFVNSAGNEGDTNVISSPSTGLNVISVGSSSFNKTISNFSSAGLDSSYNSLLYKPTLVAPGDTLVGIPNITASISGTSFSAPIVTGIVALLMEEFPDLKYHPEKVMSILTDSCKAVSGQNSFDDHDAGFGLVNYSNARDAYLNTYTYKIATNEASDSVLFSKNINLPYGKTVFASTDVLYNPVNSSNCSPSQLKHSKVNFRVRNSNNDYVCDGVSKSNISFIAYTNSIQQSENLTLEVYLDGSKNNSSVEDCSISYRIDNFFVNNISISDNYIDRTPTFSWIVNQEFIYQSINTFNLKFVNLNNSIIMTKTNITGYSYTLTQDQWSTIIAASGYYYKVFVSHTLINIPGIYEYEICSQLYTFREPDKFFESH